MKHRVLKDDIDIIKDDMIVVVRWDPDGEAYAESSPVPLYNKGLIIKKNSSEFVSLTPDNLMNIDRCWSKNSKKEYAQEVFRMKETNRVYYFDNLDECMKWMFNKNEY